MLLDTNVRGGLYKMVGFFTSMKPRELCQKKLWCGLQNIENAAKELERLIKVANQDKKQRWKPVFRQLRDTTKRQKGIPPKTIPKKDAAWLKM